VVALDFRAARTRLRALEGSAGYTLVEVIIVMALLLTVCGALADGFASASRAEVDQTQRASDQEAARLSLDRMRRDIHCASGATVTPTTSGGTPNGGYILTLTETANVCPTVTTASAGIQWCTIPISAQRFQLYRENSGNCDGINSTFEEDYVTAGNVWSLPTCSTGQFPSVAIDMPVNRDPFNRAARVYELKDQIALRNAPIC
jgi:prepilin-type N-terminal cleavage/methylation domain-containing protein